MVMFSRVVETQILLKLISVMTPEELDQWLASRSRIDRIVIEIHLGARKQYGWLKDADRLVFTAHTENPDRWVERLVDVMDLDHPYARREDLA